MGTFSHGELPRLTMRQRTTTRSAGSKAAPIFEFLNMDLSFQSCAAHRNYGWCRRRMSHRAHRAAAKPRMRSQVFHGSLFIVTPSSASDPIRARSYQASDRQRTPQALRPAAARASPAPGFQAIIVSGTLDLSLDPPGSGCAFPAQVPRSAGSTRMRARARMQSVSCWFFSFSLLVDVRFTLTVLFPGDEAWLVREAWRNPFRIENQCLARPYPAKRTDRPLQPPERWVVHFQDLPHDEASYDYEMAAFDERDCRQRRMAEVAGSEGPRAAANSRRAAASRSSNMETPAGVRLSSRVRSGRLCSIPGHPGPSSGRRLRIIASRLENYSRFALEGSAEHSARAALIQLRYSLRRGMIGPGSETPPPAQRIQDSEQGKPSASRSCH